MQQQKKIVMCTFSEYNKIKMYLVLHFKVSSHTEAVWLRDLQFIQDMAWQKTNDEHTRSEVKLRSASTNPDGLRPSCYFAVASACVCVSRGRLQLRPHVHNIGVKSSPREVSS